MNQNIYIYELGYRNAVTEYEDIIWFWEQCSKRYKSKAVITKYWLGVLNAHEKHLIKIQAYELLATLKSKVTKEQRINSAKHKLRRKAEAELEMKKYMEWHNNLKLKVMLTTIKNYN